MGVSENSGTPKSSIFTVIGFSIINLPFWGTTIFGNTQICVKPGVTFSVRTLPGFSGWKFQAALQLRAVENDAIPQLQAPIVEMAPFFGWEWI